jgi:hypothetical protein
MIKSPGFLPGSDERGILVAEYQKADTPVWEQGRPPCKRDKYTYGVLRGGK